MGLSKGVVYTPARAFVEERFGAAGLEQCLRKLSADDRALFLSVLPVGWYPMEPCLRFQRIMDREFGKGDLELCRELGRFAGDWQINSVLRVLLRMRSPDWLPDRGMRMWRQYHDSGRWEVERTPGQLVGRLYDFAVADEAWCIRFGAFLQRAVELTGGKNVSVREGRCRAHGDKFCEYMGHWD